MLRNTSLMERLWGLMAMAIATLLVWHFHDRYWWPPDEGVYAYTAQRMLAGDVLHRDLVDIHPGLVNFVHVAAFRIFGMDLVSLRYPLVLLTLIQSALVFMMLADRGTVTAVVAAVGVAATSFVQYLNPSANWYALGVFFVTLATLYRRDPRAWQTAAIAGVMIGVCFMTRQLSAVFLAMGIVTWMLAGTYRSTEAREGRVIPILITGIMAAGLIWYVAGKQSVMAWLLAGLWPLLMLCLVGWRARMTAREALPLLAGGVVGFAAALLPFVAYFAAVGALGAWFDDIVVKAFTIHEQPFILNTSIWILLREALQHIAAFDDAAAVVSGVAWFALLSLMPITGYLALRAPDMGGLIAIAGVFWMLVAIHFQIPNYFDFTLPAVVAAFLWLAPKRRMACALVMVLSGWMIICHAGQPASRGWSEIAAGERSAAPTPAGMPRNSLLIEPSERNGFQRVLLRIAMGARPNEPVMTLPMDPVINFMADRRAPVDYYGAPMGLRNADDVAMTIERLDSVAPLFVVHRRDDKYLNDFAADVLDRVRSLSGPPEPIGPFDLYRYPGPFGHSEPLQQ